MRVLFDGWPLVYQSAAPESLHLLGLLTGCYPEVQPMIALPGPPPGWLPECVESHVVPTPETPRGHLDWLRRILPGVAQRYKADLLHLFAPGAAVFSSLPCVASPAGFDSLWQAPTPARRPAARPAGIYERLLYALNRAGLARLRGLLWPADLPPPTSRASLRLLPPYVYPGSEPKNPTLPILPEAFVLYAGPTAEAFLEQTLAAWRWAAPAIGQTAPLALLGLPERKRQAAAVFLKAHNLQETTLLLPALRPEYIPLIFQQCAAVFHPAPASPWEGPLRQGLAAGKPVVAASSPMAEALVGPAAYLADPLDARTLGAGIITVVVEESLASQLGAAAKERSAAWTAEHSLDHLWERLFEVYQQAVTGRG